MSRRYQHVYFVGIGGIGMSALARYFRHRNYVVCGYDKTPTPLTSALQSEGIQVHFDDAVPQYLQEEWSKQDTLIVYTPAIPKTSILLQWLKENGFDMKKRAEVLGLITNGHDSAAVAGTHGKTTTSTLLAHLLQDGDLPVNAFLGGISVNYQTNLLLADSNRYVTEADEYDRSFLQLHPHYGVVTSTDADHLDIYQNANYVTESYQAFAKQVTRFLLVRSGLQIQPAEHCRMYHYGEEGDFRYRNVRVEQGYFVFDYEGPLGRLDGLRMPLPGIHNIENAVAAISIALFMGMDLQKVSGCLARFRGVKRRFERVAENEQCVYLDDYAHHPTEIEALAKSLRLLFPGKRITALFQPHLFTRTRDFADGFAQSLSLFDEVGLMPIYPARELPIEGVNSEMLAARMENTSVEIIDEKSVLNWVKRKQPEVLVTVGAGDIDRQVSVLKAWIEEGGLS